MIMQPQGQQPDRQPRPYLRQRCNLWIRIGSACLLTIVFIIFLIIVIKYNSNNILILTASIAVSCISVLIPIFQWIFSRSSNGSRQRHHPVRRPPVIDSMTIEHQSVVDEVCKMLENPDTSTIILRGIYGIGKSTLANLVVMHIQKQRDAGKIFFIRKRFWSKKSIQTEEPIWLDIDGIATFQDLSDLLFSAFNKTGPDLHHCLPQAQADKVLKPLQRRPGLIVLNFTAPFHSQQRQFPLAGDPGFKEWLKAMNSQPCAARVILTDCPCIEGFYQDIYTLSYIKEFPVKGLSKNEGVEFLKKPIVNATDRELRKLVDFYGAHPGALSRMNNFLLHHHTLSVNLILEEQCNGSQVPVWESEIYNEFVESDYQQLNPLEQEVLRSFAVHRIPAPFEAGYIICAHLSEMDVHMAVHKLVRLDLIQDEGGHYMAPALVAKCALMHCDNSSWSANQAARRTLHDKAAQYYLGIVQHNRSSRPQQQQLPQIRPDPITSSLYEAVWHSFRAGKVQEGMDLARQENLLEFMDLIFS